MSVYNKVELRLMVLTTNMLKNPTERTDEENEQDHEDDDKGFS